ncbi:protein phosphatase 1 regulatory subunit 1A isoform X2 [Dromaius novaehollandiae]|uniref:protein phosphatase 1 regulatory subunit 1A isoform X2 n=1 Tax=Dromaius novaehollandiae TaxID=8790 RepID=UPI00311F0E86
MEPNSPRKIQFTVPLLEPHLDPEAAEQIRRRRPTPANLVLSSDQSSPELQMMVEHHLCKQAQGEEEEEEAAAAGSQDQRSPGCCRHGDTEHSHSPGGTCSLAHAQPAREGGPAPGAKGEVADPRGDGRQSLAGEGTHISPKEAVGKGAATSQ